MKKTILIYILFHWCYNGLAQEYSGQIDVCYFPECFKYDDSKVPKAETIKWLSQKFNLYTPADFKYMKEESEIWSSDKKLFIIISKKLD